MKRSTQQDFELTAEEMALAIRMFGAMREIEEVMADTARRTFLRAVEELAVTRPRRPAPRLRLVSGGAK